LKKKIIKRPITRNTEILKPVNKYFKNIYSKSNTLVGKKKYHQFYTNYL